MSHFGWSMDGLETAISDRARMIRGRFQPCTYLEIGVARGETLASVAQVLRAKGASGWRAIGVDLPNGYSLEKPQVEQNCTNKMLNLAFIKPQGWTPIDPTWEKVSVILADSRDFFEGIWCHPIHFALVDACHCNECVKRDFLNVEKYVPVGGLVMLHDYEKRLETAPQPHGGHCDVFRAAEELGLAQGTRNGWGPPEVLEADHKRPGANMLVIERTSL